MILKRLGLLGLLAGLGIGVSGCADGYGYGGVDVGYGGGGYYDGYGGGYPGYGYAGYNPGYFGWYGDYYYPGTGVYVYDRGRRAHRWNEAQRSYWSGRRGNGRVRDNWADFRHDDRGDLRDNRQAYRNGAIARGQFRDDRQDARREYHRDVRQDHRQTRRENHATRGEARGGARGNRGGHGRR